VPDKLNSKMALNRSEEAAGLLSRIRILTALFMLGIVVSGLTAFPLEWELDTLCRWLGVPGQAPATAYSGLTFWLVTVRNALDATYLAYPFIAYGTDWLAFGHVMIAIAFVGAWRDPVRNVWLYQFGLIACALVVPTALLCGPLRGIPFYWRLIDCLFGVVGSLPLLVILGWVRRLEELVSYVQDAGCKGVQLVQEQPRCDTLSSFLFRIK